MFVDGERLSYRELDVEQLGSFYESMMGFEVARAKGPSIGLKPRHIVICVEDLIQQPPGSRVKWLMEHAHCSLSKFEKDADPWEKGFSTPGRGWQPLRRACQPRGRG